MSNNLIFHPEKIYFYEFKDKNFKEFLTINGAEIISDINKSTLIIYTESKFRKSESYQIAKKNKIEYIHKNNFLENYQIISEDDDYSFNIANLSSDYKSTDTESSEISLSRSPEKIMCKLINQYIIKFYDNIYITYDEFKDEEFNMDSILKNNMHILFYSKKYLTTDDLSFFYTVFNKYVNLIKSICDIESQLSIFLQSWKKSKSKTYLKQIINDKKYSIISPIYLANQYKSIFAKYKHDTNLFDKKYKKKLNSILTTYKQDRKIFAITYKKIVNLYICEYPLSYNSVYTKGFINSVILTILDFSDKLIDNNIYAIHPIVTNITDKYIILDDCISYNSKDNNNKKLLII